MIISTTLNQSKVLLKVVKPINSKRNISLHYQQHKNNAFPLLGAMNQLHVEIYLRFPVKIETASEGRGSYGALQGMLELSAGCTKYAGHAGQVQRKFKMSSVALQVNSIKCPAYRLIKE